MKNQFVPSGSKCPQTESKCPNTDSLSNKQINFYINGIYVLVDITYI